MALAPRHHQRDSGTMIILTFWSFLVGITIVDIIIVVVADQISLLSLGDPSHPFCFSLTRDHPARDHHGPSSTVELARQL